MLDASTLDAERVIFMVNRAQVKSPLTSTFNEANSQVMQL
jgi:hypothetical protein